MRLVHFSHRGLKRFGVLLSDDRVLDLTHFFADESVLRSAGEDGMKTVREAVERAMLRRSVGGTLYSLGDVVLESPDPGASAEGEMTAVADESPSGHCGLWAAQTGHSVLQSGFGIHLVRKLRASRR